LQVKALRTPTLFVCAEKDWAFPEKRIQAAEVLSHYCLPGVILARLPSSLSACYHPATMYYINTSMTV
jgi:hypothetical protein